jgi:gliding motility-associated-like protein
VIQTGPPPPADYFKSSGEPGHTDAKWKVAKDSITGIYQPAVIMTSLDPVYFPGGKWISFSATGEHTGDKFFFYRLDFDLPCFNLCGKSYDDDNSFCLNLDLYADNSVYEIYVNGVPQSPGSGNNFPIQPDPYNPAGHTQSDPTTVSLCSNWKAGSNSLIIQAASSATVAGLSVLAAAHPPPPPDAYKIDASICEGETYRFDTMDLTKPGIYTKTYTRPSGCDSIVALYLDVKPKSATTIDQSICEGESYEGYTVSGTYTDVYTAANGCDSVRILHLNVREKPRPDLGLSAAICEGDSLRLSPGTFSTYEWQDGSTKDYFTVKNTGVYAVTVTNACGVASDEISVTGGLCDIYFPSAFTPNNDGKNDFFKILTDYLLEEYHLTVYNRWGQKVFETTNPSGKWNGNFNEKAQSTGVFVWYCTFKREGVKRNVKGTVLLIKQ